MKFGLLFILLVLTSCSFLSRRNQNHEANVKEKFVLNDKSGKFLVFTETGVNKKSNFIFKKQIVPSNGDLSTPLERAISISKKSMIKLKEGGSLNVLGPEISQYTVWFDGKKYFSEMKIKPQGKLQVKFVSPEASKSGTKDFDLPKSTGVRCFFSQVIDCVRETGFLKLTEEKGAGKMNFQVLWDGYPFLQEQYTGLANVPFSQAVFEYDGKNKNDERRYTLKAGGQSIFYFVDQDNHFKKMFWVSEGLSLSRLTESKISKSQIKNDKTEKIYSEAENEDADFENESE